ncbi:hypothetical protein ACEPAG_100 [Sanghuangporus baumii]
MTATGSAVRLPDWLKRALFNREYQRYVYTVLADREKVREAARTLSRERRKSRRSLLHNSIVSGLVKSSLPDSHKDFYRVDVGTERDNVPENRYYAIEPFDRTRVVVGQTAEGKGRYLNANWVRELHGGHWWIATQAPLPNTAHAFLSLFLQPDTQPPSNLAPPDSLGPQPCRLRTTVQLTMTTEGGRTKAHPYFPAQVGGSYIIPAPEGCMDPALKISLEAEQEDEWAGCIQSTLRLVHCTQPSGEQDMLRYSKVEELDEPVFFTHLLFTHWPDFGVPEGPEEKACLLSFARLVARVNLSAPPNGSTSTDIHPDPPIVVNCSAGVGRTGSFIALNSLLRSHGMLLPEYNRTSPQSFPPLPPSPQGPLPSDLAEDEVAFEVDSLREQRTSMVQRPEQQMLIYELLAAAYHEAEERANKGSIS